MSCLTRRDYRAIILYNFKRALTTKQCYDEMFMVFRDDCPSLRTIERWYKNFQNNNFNLEDDPRSGRPAEVTTPENIAAVQKLVNENRHITYREIQDTLKINAPAVHEILHNKLELRKRCMLWVPHKLTDEQRTQRVKWCKNMLKKFKSGQSNAVNSIVTGDETWLYYYDIPSKSRNKIWVFNEDEPPTMVKQSRSVKKRMIVVFFGKRGIIKRVVLENQRTVTAKWYIENCLPQVLQALETLRPNSRMNTWFFHHDNAPAHRAHATVQFLEDSGLQVLNHAPYSPDLAPCDFGLFPYIKNQLKGRRFSNDEELITAWDEACGSVPEEKWENIFDDWFVRMRRCIECDGKYFEKL